jgi:hypothetical protein
MNTICTPLVVYPGLLAEVGVCTFSSKAKKQLLI